MTPTSASALLAEAVAALAPPEDANRFVPLVAAGSAPLAAVAALAAEQSHIILSDRRSFLTLAARADGADTAGFFATLGQGENLVIPMLPPLAAAAGLEAERFAAYEPTSGCQGYPSYLAWLALNADPTEAVVALSANFAAWGGYCAALAEGLRKHYGFDDEACAFFDFFAAPAPDLDRSAEAAIQVALDEGRELPLARRYGRLLQSYEIQFWSTLADL
jgi:hypothetical protein